MRNEQVTPAETKGVAVEVLATVDLAGEIEGMQGHQLRMRMVTIEPGGVFGPIHDHKGRPGTVYILQGMITDHRDGVVTEYGPGVGWSEDRYTTHWLENRGTVPAVEISVDIVRTDCIEPCRTEQRATGPSTDIVGCGGRLRRKDAPSRPSLERAIRGMSARSGRCVTAPG
ncbi:MAG: cupin domain-containing protein [Mycobacteriaceae bacterium]